MLTWIRKSSVEGCQTADQMLTRILSQCSVEGCQTVDKLRIWIPSSVEDWKTADQLLTWTTRHCSVGDCQTADQMLARIPSRSSVEFSEHHTIFWHESRVSEFSLGRRVAEIICRHYSVILNQSSVAGCQTVDELLIRIPRQRSVKDFRTADQKWSKCWWVANMIKKPG